MPSLPIHKATNTILEAATALPVGNLGSTFRDEQAPKVGVLLLNLGGPETGDDVEGRQDIT